MSDWPLACIVADLDSSRDLAGVSGEGGGVVSSDNLAEAASMSSDEPLPVVRNHPFLPRSNQRLYEVEAVDCRMAAFLVSLRSSPVSSTNPGGQELSLAVSCTASGVECFCLFPAE